MKGLRTPNGESIMIVDEAEDRQEIASIIFRRLGYQVSSVSSGEQRLIPWTSIPLT
ncbi:hypothetical protein ACFL0H_14445 [Thermodesulfobacteriota bacterium]